MMDEYDFNMINTDEPTYQKAQGVRGKGGGGGGMSVLDITLVSSALSFKCNWSVIHDDTLASDHLPTLATGNERQHRKG
jgi:hypothetical protein